ncbi:peptidoglycan editing factor PgeF [Trichocoleus sp. FACHB-262]|uniref:peptidoglycan editing factor PgeF n=1 Tax=Trichocoleus sp. FACHB-262 TaxID=2692869 RepID=UPI0016877B3C|nr:peptidoglycan editing factor PgeF [Trichocoleus sp. FACHB-262]MBD2119653.1 peptidoglycan editing factor PgeF [Trichocoleus sp. FACHB-262]
MHTWHWQTWDGRPYLTCSLLERWSHGFFTQHFWPQTPSHLVSALQSEAQVYRVRQVHGNVVLAPSEIELSRTSGNDTSAPEPDLPPADGLLTEQAEQAVWVCSADCTPVLIADATTGQVAAVHAGWRGTAAKIVPQAIARLQAQGSQLHNLRVAMGPAIAGDVYQVSLDVAAVLGATITPVADTATKVVIEQLHALPEPPVFADPEPDRIRVDVRRVNALQLEQLGLSPEQVAIAPHCTYQQPEHFFSYRRDGLKRVQWSGIVSQAVA